jgi:hypothetical protein
VRSIIIEIARTFIEVIRMKAFSRLLIAAIGAAAFVSCTQNGGLIYLNIQKTTKTNTSTSIPLDITVSDIVNIGTGASPYYVAAGKVYNGSVSSGSTNWSAISVPQSGGKDMLCNALTYDGTNLWGAFFSSDGETFKLAHATPGGPWTEDAGSGSPDGQQITYLGADSGGNVFAATATMVNGSYTYSLYARTGSAWVGPNATSALTGISKPITGIALVGPLVTGTYFATSGNTLYTAPAGGLNSGLLFAAVSSAVFPSSSGDLLRGIFVDPTVNLVIVPSSNQTSQTTGIGGVFFSTDNGTSFAEATTNAQTSYTVGFLCVAGPVDSGHTTYLLGADCGYGGAFGFFSFTPSNGGLNRFGGLSYSLYASTVNRIMVDTTNNIVAMGTVNNGLWVTYPVDTTGGFGSNTWTQE